MTNIDEVIAEITMTPPGKVTVWAGAGISVPSGLPTARGIIEELLSHFPAEPHDVQLLVPATGLALPFEAFIEVATENAEDINISLLEFFELGEPNPNHHFLAFLLKTAHAREIYTTNFDCLTETALIDTGLQQKRDFLTYYMEDDFHNVGDSSANLPAVVKVHGSIENRESLRATLNGIADQSLSTPRFSLVTELFSGSRYDTILVMGYSCSDFFDIIPTIRSVALPKAKIIFIEHHADEGTFEVLDLPVPVFSNYNGIRVRVNTSVFVRALSRAYGFLPPLGAQQPADWRPLVTKWYEKLKKPHLPSTILGQLFYRASLADRALFYYKQALNKARDAGDITAQGAVVNNLGLVLQENGQYSEAVENFRLAHSLFEKAPLPRGKAASHANLGWAYAYLDIEKSIYHSQKAISLAIELSLNATRLNSLNNLGLAYKRKGRFRDAIGYYKKAIEISSGDKRGEVTTLINMADAHRHLWEFGASKDLLDQALELAREIGFLAGRVRALRLMVVISRHLDADASSITWDEEAEALVAAYNLVVPEVE